MSTALDLSLGATVVNLIARLGKTVSFTVKTVGAYDETTGHAAESDPVVYSKKVSPPDKYDRRLVDGHTIQKDDLKVIVPGKDLEWNPLTLAVSNIVVTIDGKLFNVIKVTPIYSGDDVAAYEYQLRV